MKSIACTRCDAPLLSHETVCPHCQTPAPPPARPKGIRCTCTKCGTRFRVPKSQAGKTVDCRQCGKPVRVPQPDRPVDARMLVAAAPDAPQIRTYEDGWDDTREGLNRVYFFGCIAGFTLIAWLTSAVVLGMFVVLFIMFPTRPWMPFMLLIALSGGAVRGALESEHDIRLYAGYIALAWLLATPFLGVPWLGVIVLALVFGGGFAVLLICLFGGGYGLVDALAIPASAHARGWLLGTLAAFGLAVACFVGAIVMGAIHINELADPVGIPWFEELLLGGTFLVILGNCLFGLFLWRIPHIFGDRATAAYVGRYLAYMFTFATAAVLISLLLQTGALESSSQDFAQTGPFIARVVYVLLGIINLFWLLQCVAAARDDIRPYFRA